MMNNLEGVIGKNLLGHEVTDILTNANPATMVFLALGGERSAIHMVVDGVIKFERK